MTGLTLDAGALIAFEKGDRHVRAAIRDALAEGRAMTIPAAVLAQVWRDGARQAVLSRLLTIDGIRVEPLDERLARAAGRLCGVTRTRDVIDASVVVGAKIRGDAVLTSDVDDLRRLDDDVELVAV
jgi:hypothetical protein